MSSSAEICEIRFLGPVEVECNAGRIESQLPKKGLALLAFLSLSPGVSQPRQKLADLLWSDLSEEAARNNLRQAMLGMKRHLESKESRSSCLVSDRHSVRFEAGGRYYADTAAFLAPIPECPPQTNPENCAECLARLEAMAHLYRGQFLENIILDGSIEFEDWLQVQRETLQQRALFILERLARCFEGRGNDDGALFYANRFLELAPWSDEGIRRVMRLAALSGQRGFALSRYQGFCRTLKEELGVPPEEKTRKLAQSIQDGELMVLTQKSDSVRVTRDQPAQDIEKRQLTICYCQLTPARDEDPEDEVELLKIPFARCQEILRNGQGHVVRNDIGGGLLAYFGYPQAQENAAVLAVRAALSLTAESFPDVSLRIGVHTAVALSAQDKEQPDMTGRPSGRAVGLTSLSGSGEIVISDATRVLVEDHFRCRNLGEHYLPGGERPVSCFKVEQTDGFDCRPDPADVLSPLVGRDEELAFLKQLWRSVTGGEGRALLLSGEPGIGKSRLAGALKDSAGDDAHVLELRGFAEFRQSPFKPLTTFLNNLLNLSSSDSSTRRRAVLTQAVERWCPDRADQIVPLAAELLSLSCLPSRSKPRASLHLREQTMSAILDLLSLLAEQKPVMLIVEDLHWIDPTTLEILTKIIERGVPGSVFLLMTARPEFQPVWPETEMSRLQVASLPDEQIRSLVATGSSGLSAPVIDRIVERADGVPLFAEELSRLPADSLASEKYIIPATLQDLLAVRLDGLAKDKKLAQLAATIGREFFPDLLAKLSLKDETEVMESLFRLKHAGLLSILPANRWQFRHALIRDAAYLSQTRADRESAHLRIAQILTTDFPDAAREQPMLLAYHWSRAGETEPAVRSWIEAGLLAQAHNAHHEALKHFRAGLELLPRLQGSQAERELEWQLQVGVGASAYAIEGYASPQGMTAYNRAVELGEQEGSLKQGFPALWGLWASASSYSSWAHSLKLAKRLVRIVRNGKDSLARQQGYFAMGNVQFWRGEFETSRRYLEQSISEYSPQHHDRLVSSYGENSYATAGSYLSWNLCLLGFPDQALKSGQHAVAEAGRVGHPFSLGYALTFYTVLHRMLRQPAATLELAEKTIVLADQHDFLLWHVGATLKKGWAHTMLGKPQGLGEMQWSVDQVGALMSGITLIFLETQADGLYRAGHLQEALRVIEKGLELVDRLDDHHVEAELYRLQGCCLLELADGSSEKAENCFSLALKTSRQQKALLLELRAAMALATLRSRQNRVREGRELLADVYNRFTEGFSFPDLCAAQKLLAALSP